MKIWRPRACSRRPGNRPGAGASPYTSAGPGTRQSVNLVNLLMTLGEAADIRRSPLSLTGVGL